jgi:predicted nuclease with TOPRIM domain
VQVEASRDAAVHFRSNKAELEHQLNIVGEECTMAKDQMEERWTVYQEVRKQYETVSSELERLKEAQNAKFAEVKELRDLLRKLPDKYYENRRFSQKV